MGGRGVGADRVGAHGVGHSPDVPDRLVGTVPPRRGREPAVLHGHMGQQIGQRPLRARSGAVQVGGADRVDGLDGTQDGDAVKGA